MKHPIEKDYRDAANLVAGKAHDYAEADNPFSNFEYAAMIAGITVEQVFMVQIAIKTARLGQLVGKGKEPNNESIDDNLLDSMNYPGLMRAYRRVHRDGLTIEEAFDEAITEDLPIPSWSPPTENWNEGYTYLVGDKIALKNQETHLGDDRKLLTYVITEFEPLDNRVVCVPTPDLHHMLGKDERRFAPKNIQPA